ncbi:unnamed protein product [Triticum turgidum subsp. durum]|uniref:Ubiquinone biosynthesis monooxygenase COQ6, mitochondrial n=1 Tax=Triticum turgidum subsp. durum TaxID=4567 RepID=A0A9R0W3D5_TRITD|nr:unnamed protein product [Triticum turgidum subsp. durum]
MTPTPARASAAAAHTLLRRTRCFAAANQIRTASRAFSSAPAGASEPQGPEKVAGDDELDVAIVGGGMVGLAVACALSNMPLTKHLRVAVIDSNPALKSMNYLKKDGIPDSRVSTVTPATISFFRDIGAWEHILQQRHAFFGKMQVMTYNFHHMDGDYLSVLTCFLPLHLFLH